jgi:ABC-type multidrug transport system fused ATPase/permease subunit
MNTNYGLTDRSQKPFYLLWKVQKWLALVLDLIIAALAVLVVGVIVALRDTVSPGFSGVSLTQIISITGYLKLLIMFWTQLEMSLGAVMRIKRFADVTRDEDGDSALDAAPPDWPQSGSIQVSNMSVVYR